MKTLHFLVVMALAAVLSGGSAAALDDADRTLLDPQVDVDLVVLYDRQSKTVTADLAFPLDFGIVPVVLEGNGAFTATLSQTGTSGELYYIMLQGFGVPSRDFNFGVSPVTLRVRSEISEFDDSAFGVVIHGLLFSPEDPPFSYNVNLSF